MNIFVGNIIANDFYTIVGYSLPGMTCSKYAKYNFTIHQIDAHGNVLKELMSTKQVLALQPAV